MRTRPLRASASTPLTGWAGESWARQNERHFYSLSPPSGRFCYHLGEVLQLPRKTVSLLSPWKVTEVMPTPLSSCLSPVVLSSGGRVESMALGAKALESPGG